MSQADSSNTLTRLNFASAGAVRRRPSDVPSAYAVGPNAWVPCIDHSGRSCAYVRFETFRRKVKESAEAATEYARRTIAWRAHREGFKRRKLEAISHPRWQRYFSEAAE
jgi:hypothetical protein